MPCIYKILCTVNNRYYIGSAICFKKRKTTHLSTLKHNKHHNTHLQRIYNKYGRQSLSFSIVEECDKESLFGLEQLHIDECWSDKLCINQLKSSTYGDTLSQHPNKKEIIRKRSESLRKTMDKMGESGRKETWGRSGKQNGSFGKTHTLETRIKCSDAGKKGAATRKQQMKGKTFEEQYGKEKAKAIKNKLSETKKKTQKGQHNGFYGKSHTEEIKQKDRDRMTGNYGYNKSKPFTIDGTEYISLKHASDTLNVPVATVAYRVKSKNFKHWKYV